MASERDANINGEGTSMPALTKSHTAAIRACIAPLEAFDPDRTAVQCRDLMRIAIENAMDATGLPKGRRPKVEELLDCYEWRAAPLPA